MIDIVKRGEQHSACRKSMAPNIRTNVEVNIYTRLVIRSIIYYLLALPND